MVGLLLHLQYATSSTVHLACRSSNLHRPSSRLAQMKHQAHQSPSSSWASLQADVEAHLKHAMPMKEPLVVFEPMHHLSFAAPATAVPALCVAACELVGGQRHRAMPAASALLLMLAASYTHEHLPLTDRPKPKPRPEPMIRHVYGPNIELLTGDGIVPLAFELLARSDDPARDDSDRVLRVIIEIARAVGSVGLVEGQYRKITTGGSGSDGGEVCHVESIRRVAEKIGGEMHACGGACGAILGGGSEDEIERLRKYGFYVGIIQGLLLQRGEIEKEEEEKLIMEEVEKVRDLALMELEAFEVQSMGQGPQSKRLHIGLALEGSQSCNYG
ncbi:heterodimeric geranylgeranyl pyrophosphate synthase small subunit, chloroplastic-like [Senna tora]|uniref:Heterodimeric geranylgeranyl pyrophosphate synthase small subunit, chloroplastic-like n=1 Tax=Senna tora TaxID=362788 RepID=A0A834WPK6_9FABA|nr:heterodimeric geranylgeranyl pyrophosphate synthase small subunit, chloroplastic-like [Senna tora]